MIDESEAIEVAALQSLHDAAGDGLRATLGLAAESVAQAFVSVASKLPASAIVINRAIGLGLGAAATRGGVDDLVETYRHRSAPRFFVHLHPEANPDLIPGWLEALGLEKTRGWMKFVRGTEPPPEAPTDLRVEKIGIDKGPAFGAIVSDAFDLGPAAAQWLALLPGQPGWHIYMTFSGEKPAGTGALFVRDGIGWSDWGATAPEFRGRGGQSALLERRVRDAIAMGCDRIHTCTGEEVPGDPQHSYKNILKMGFRETYVRANYAIPKAGNGGA